MSSWPTDILGKEANSKLSINTHLRIILPHTQWASKMQRTEETAEIYASCHASENSVTLADVNCRTTIYTEVTPLIMARHHQNHSTNKVKNQ